MSYCHGVVDVMVCDVVDVIKAEAVLGIATVMMHNAWAYTLRSLDAFMMA